MTAAASTYDVVVLGGGIVGLATALKLTELQDRRHRVLVLEKEDQLGAHQTGRNSGVIHAGVYYAPGSLKARLAVQGNASMVRFCAEQGIPCSRCGKLIVATRDRELEGLEALRRRAIGNGVDVWPLAPEEVAEREPHVRCVAGLYVPSTAIVDFGQVCRRYADLAVERGAELQLGVEALRVAPRARLSVIETSAGPVLARYVVNCAGLQSDRLASASGASIPARIIPFRGEYFELRPERSHLVSSLVYPVPDPELPFLGIHATRAIDGRVHLGPNAVLAFKREGYRRRSFDISDVADALLYPGLWRFLLRHPRAAAGELYRSLRRAAFVASAQRLLPDLRVADLDGRHAGVRAQAVMRDGSLADDFIFVEGRNSLHVLNAPSPGATASLEIGGHIARRVAEALA